jgi:hypothetical protein
MYIEVKNINDNDPEFVGTYSRTIRFPEVTGYLHSPGEKLTNQGQFFQNLRP